MSSKRRIRWSPQNGFIYVNADGEVLVGGFKQTSASYARLWEDAFKHIELPECRSVLMLGLAGGGAISAIREAYPHASITAVDHDPSMAEIAQELGAASGIEIIIEDALSTLDAMTRDFDLILVDIFYMLTPSPLLSKPEFWGAIGRRLTQRGVAIVNVAGSPEYLELPESLFAHSASWRYDTNVFGAFWNQH